MPRPSQNIDLALLKSGRALLPIYGCRDLSLRTLTEHANANMGMFHYHFKTKDNFLTLLLQEMYEELFSQLLAEANHEGSPIQRLTQSMHLLAKILREHGAWIGKVWADAGRDDEVAKTFLQKNGARHAQLIIGLILEAQSKDEIQKMAPLQALTFLMGAVISPMLIAPRMIQMGFAPTSFVEQIHSDVLSDIGIAERIERAIYALRK